MIIDVNAILLVEKKKKKKKKKSRLVVTTNKEITETFLAQEGNFGEVVKTSSILNEIGEKRVEILGKKMAKHIAPIVEEVETQLIEKEGMHNVPTYVDMEKEKVQKDEMITGGKDEKSQYLEDEDVEIIVVPLLPKWGVVHLVFH
jgi:hypothetical protein